MSWVSEVSTEANWHGEGGRADGLEAHHNLPSRRWLHNITSRRWLGDMGKATLTLTPNEVNDET